MVFHLKFIDEDLLYEHVFERYVQLGSLSDILKQDLGVFNKTGSILEVDIEPPAVKKLRKKNAKSRTELQDSFNLVVEQSITSLYSSRDNANSTTGYVLWSATPFFLKWLLYDENAEPLRRGDSVKVINDPKRLHMNVPPLLSKSDCLDPTCILELGSGIAGIMPIVLGNYVDTYLCTDQRGILNKLKFNLRENLLQLNKRQCISDSLGINQVEARPDDPSVKLEVIQLDWENFKLESDSILLKALTSTKRVHILAMDVIYNEFLIDPFLRTLNSLIKYLQKHHIEAHAIIGIQLRSEAILTEFLEKSVIEYELPIYHISDSTLDLARFSLYYL